MTPAPGAVAAVVLGAQGGTPLARTLASVAWAGERVVLDPTGRLAGAELPAGVRRVAGAALPEDLTAAWILLLHEDETVPPALAVEVQALAASAAPTAYAVRHEVRVYGASLLPRRPALRLARRGTADLALGLGLAIALAPRTRGRPGVLVARLVVEEIGSLNAAVEQLDADAAVLAALLRARGIRPRLWHLVLPPLVAGSATLGARGRRLGWGRWIVTVLAGYRTLTAYAKLWELRHGEASAPS